LCKQIRIQNISYINQKNFFTELKKKFEKNAKTAVTTRNFVYTSYVKTKREGKYVMNMSAY
jgi:hypothetical protein